MPDILKVLFLNSSSIRVFSTIIYPDTPSVFGHSTRELGFMELFFYRLLYKIFPASVILRKLTLKYNYFTFAISEELILYVYLKRNYIEVFNYKLVQKIDAEGALHLLPDYLRKELLYHLDLMK